MTIKQGHNYEVLPAYINDDDITGKIDLELDDTEKYEHLGLKYYLIGYLGNLHNK